MKKLTKQQKQILSEVIGENVLLAIGIDQYVNKKDTLSCCENDAEDVYHVFASNNNLNLKKNDSVLLKSSNTIVSKKVVMDNLQKICKNSTFDSNFVFYFSGHGLNIEDVFYFVLQDSDVQKRETLLAIDEVLEPLSKSSFKSKVILIDACQIKQEGRKGVIDNSFKFQKHFIENAYGMAIIYSCSPGEYSQEAVADMRNSVFTNLLLQALRGKEDAIEGHYLSIKSMMNFLAEESQRYSAKYQQVCQHPYIQFEGVNDIFLGLFDDDAASCLENNNSCTINVDAKPDFFEQDKIRKKLQCLLNQERWVIFKGLIGELIYNMI